MDTFWWWWIAALVLVAVEMVTGTVYLLMVALGLAACGVAAWLGQGFTVQLLVAAVIGVVGCVVVQRTRVAKPSAAPPQRNEDVQIDIGNLVTVDEWSADGSAQVQYRGAVWTARLDKLLLNAPSAASLGAHRIAAMQGNVLLVTAVATAAA